jgi:hypothetical protein
MDKITIPKADVGYNITLTATDSAGVAKDCSTYTTYKLQVWLPGLDPDTAENLTINTAFSWTSAAGGTGYYTIATGNFATAGLYHARIYLAKTGVEEKLSTFAIVVADPTLYVTVDEVKSELGITVDTNDDFIQQMCKDASDFVDNHCRRTFAVETAGTRYFDGSDKDRLFIDDLLSVTTLKVDADCDGTYEDTYTADTDYILWPTNTTPKTMIYLSDRASRSYSNFGGNYRKIVQIVGNWGYQSTVPANVRRAALIKAVELYKQRQSGYTGIIGGSEMGQQAIDPRVRFIIKDLLAPYVKTEYC